MDGKVIVVTGALGALGRVVVDEALERGARIASVDHAPTQAPATADLFELGGVDLTDAAQAGKAIAAAASHFGKLDALINIAGGFAFETVADGDPKTWQRMYALNVMTAPTPPRARSASAPRRRGIINRRDGRAADGTAWRLCRFQGRVHRLTEALAAELKGKITVNACCPRPSTRANRPACPKRISPNGWRRSWPT